MKILLMSSLLVVVVYGGLVKDLKAIIDTVNKSGAKWRAGHYFAENSTLSSLKKLLGSIDLPTRRVTSRPRYLIPDTAIPEQFDSRDHWPQCPSIKHIRDQGNCGSCWAVAAAGTFTDRLCIASNGTFTESLSQEELLSCCHECGYGCRGGYTKMAWEYFAEYGIVTGGDYQSKEGCQPYEIISCAHHVKDDGPPCDTIPEQETPKCQKNCSNPLYTKSFESDHHKVKSAYMIINDTKEIQKEIMAHGPVEASYVVYDDFFTYTSGIYHHLTGELQGKHAVKIIGWGVEADTPYWLVANQWRDSWGEKGFFRILRGKDECGIESEVVAGIPEL